MTQTIATAATSAAVSGHASAILLIATTGRFALCCSRYKSPVPILTICRNASVCASFIGTEVSSQCTTINHVAIDRTTDIENRRKKVALPCMML
ncbi:unnamed protein product [Cylicocyclus nassatus]|uniref:Pyruvate kinase C-terminal domain-containing protein n=1 Tax=Cylicocyclus nassatus TaxID=53992 RepID=A0AA36DIU0_CYLNA|nr:unnamed protein product [Cylicocyclus nassatus]